MKIKGLKNALNAKELKDYLSITIAMLFHCIGWTVFLLPNNITADGVPDISSVLYWRFGIPVQYSYFFINAVLTAFALRLLGLRFCIRTILDITILITLTSLAQTCMLDVRLLSDQSFMVSAIDAALRRTGVRLSSSANGSAGGTDVAVAIINKHRGVSLGRVISTCNLMIISSGYLISHDWEKVTYSYVMLFITPFCIGQVVNSMRHSVQFFIISDRYEEIGRQTNGNPHRGCTVISVFGFYSDREMKMLFVLTKKSGPGKIFGSINDIDPVAFVSQSAVVGAYGEGFDRFKMRQKKSSPNKLP